LCFVLVPEELGFLQFFFTTIDIPIPY
jgi:hypothetical protein